MKKPNLLLIMTDQQRWDAMGCSGGWIQTPHMDRIAKEGMRFSNCVTNSPVCIPARLSLATGLYPHNTGVWQNMGHTMSPQAKTWMQAVHEAGYRTSLFGKTHLHPHGGDLRDREDLMHAYGLDDVNEIGGPRASARCLSYMTEMWQKKGKWEAYQEDFDARFSNKPYVVRPSVLDLEDYADVYVGQQANSYLKNYDREQPWFCWVSFGGPHEPWDTPEPYDRRYRPEDMPEPVLAPNEDRDRPQGLLDSRLEERQVHFESGEEKKLRANYAGNVTLIDDQIGDILATIEARGELDNTVIVLVSDHGEMNGDYGLIYKENFLNGAVRVPLLVKTPQMSQMGVSGTVCDTLVEWMDVGPTLVELARGELPYQQFGKSLCPTLVDGQKEHRTEALSEYGGEVMLLNREWKCALNEEGQVYLLFHVKDDPQEVHNLAGLAEWADVERTLKMRILERLMASQVTSGVQVQMA